MNNFKFSIGALINLIPALEAKANEAVALVESVGDHLKEDIAKIATAATSDLQWAKEELAALQSGSIPSNTGSAVVNAGAVKEDGPNNKNTP